jgi:hydroxymethylpyrimidine pyrophosphatase-like HAD family hydrolase
MKAKSFSDWLVVSDIDGTLNNKLRRTPKVNTLAIDRFVNILGGKFTLASARNVQSLKPHYMKLPDVKTPAIVMNGAGIYDFSQEKMLWFNPIPSCGKDIIKKAMDKFPSLEIGIFTDDMIYLIRPVILSPVMMALDSLKHKKCSNIDEIPEGRWGKVIFYCRPYLKKKIKEFVLSFDCKELSYIDT